MKIIQLYCDKYQTVEKFLNIPIVSYEDGSNICNAINDSFPSDYKYTWVMVEDGYVLNNYTIGNGY